MDKQAQVFKDFFSNVGCSKDNLIAGPCSIESMEQLFSSASNIKNLGYKYFRGGAFKPRTTPSSFQGLGIQGLEYMKEVTDKLELISVCEIMSKEQLVCGYDYIDIIQIGSRNMQNFELLKEVSKIEKTVILKRGLMSTIEEFVGAAEYLREQGKKNIILCERGIRSFDVETRNTLDIMCVPIMKEKTGLPIIVDVSHSTGRKDLLLPAARVARAVNADGIMIETHPNPEFALSDKEQQIDNTEFKKFSNDLWRETYEH
ncbi:bifunctional 3-deoxy-7-phosphoheptulonate synthase/chorismate mutase [Enterococcus faecalis]